MNNKIKVLLTFLGILSMCAVVVAGWIYFNAQKEVAGFAEKESSFKEEIALLKQKNTAIQEKLDTFQTNVRQWQEKAQEATAALNNLTAEHSIVVSQYQALAQEKESLLAKNKSLINQVENLNQLFVQTKDKMPVDTSDTFLAALLEEKAVMEVEIGKLNDKITKQESLIGELKNQAVPFEQLKEEKQVLEEKLQEAKKVQDVLSNDLLQEKKKRLALEKELAKAEPATSSVMATVAKEESAPATTEVSVEIIEEDEPGADQPQQYASIQLPPIVVKAEEPLAVSESKQELFLPRLTRSRLVEVEEPQGAEIEVPSVAEDIIPEGRVITVNNKHEFVVINLGGDDGLEKGMSFDVYRNEMRIGKVEVIETRKNIAACDIKEARGTSIKINDTVRR
ncbi:MAG: hypothetical protein JW869_04325 [Candidatus Omnitrophica bacterium]|nr:hypothetical protein [Candidatus Omnitrophota bacterium]